MTVNKINQILEENNISEIKAVQSARSAQFFKKYNGENAYYQISKADAAIIIWQAGLIELPMTEELNKFFS